MEQLIERIAKAPLGLKIGVVAGALVLVTALSYFVFSLPYGPSISEIEVRIKRAEAEQVRLERDFTEKQAIANDLNRFRKEKELLEQRLDEAGDGPAREGKVEELVGGCIFLSSAASSFVNGAILYVDGGITASL